MLNLEIPEYLEQYGPSTVPGGFYFNEISLRTHSNLHSVHSIDNHEFGSLLPGTPIELHKGQYFIIGELLGAGKQGFVYASETHNSICLKLCRNGKSQKQFRRELVGAPLFTELGIKYPPILDANPFGLWIIKERWRSTVHTGLNILNRSGGLSRTEIKDLHHYTTTFSERGLCADWMPSNVIFTPANCSTFETSFWKMDNERRWSFSECFLPFWLPGGVAESAISGFPPYPLSEFQIERLRYSWTVSPEFAYWREFFGDFPLLNRDWWLY